jgi:chromosome segregation ATPase
MIARNQHSEVSTTDSFQMTSTIMDFPTLRKVNHVRRADLAAQLNSKKEEIVKLRHMLGTTEQEVFQLQSAKKKLKLQLQATKDSIHTQLNATIHDFQSYKDHISIKLGSADAEIRRLKKELQVSHELCTDIRRGKESLAREENGSIFLERKQSTYYNTDNSHTPVLAKESFAPKCFKSEPLLSTSNLISDSAKLTILNPIGSLK